MPPALRHSSFMDLRPPVWPPNYLTNCYGCNRQPLQSLTYNSTVASAPFVLQLLSTPHSMMDRNMLASPSKPSLATTGTVHQVPSFLPFSATPPIALDGYVSGFTAHHTNRQHTPNFRYILTHSQSLPSLIVTTPPTTQPTMQFVPFQPQRHEHCFKFITTTPYATISQTPSYSVMHHSHLTLAPTLSFYTLIMWVKIQCLTTLIALSATPMVTSIRHQLLSSAFSNSSGTKCSTHSLFHPMSQLQLLNTCSNPCYNAPLLFYLLRLLGL